MGTLAGWIGAACFAEFGLVQLHGAARVIGPSARGDRYFGHVFQRLFNGASERLLDEYETHSYPDQMSRILLEHGLNLLWVGLWSLGVAYGCLFPARTAWLLGLPPFMFHWGYFFAYDCASARLGDHWGELQAVVVSGGLVAAALMVRGEFPVHWLEFAVTAAVPTTLLGSCVAKQATKCHRWASGRG